MKSDQLSAVPPNFWDDSDYYTNPTPLSSAMISQAEKTLGYKLPDSYIQLLISQNGGTPRNTRFPTTTPTSWADDHIAISGICGLGGQWGIDSPELGSSFTLEEWGYPPIGILVAQCPSAGHDAVMLDYRRCGAQGEPQVVHVSVEEEEEPHITVLADSFREFLAGLVSEEQFALADTDDFDDFQELPAGLVEETPVLSAGVAKKFPNDLARVNQGQFSDLLQALCQEVPEVPNIETVIRRISRLLTQSKGYFALHDDPLSNLLYDLQFWLYSRKHPVSSASAYLDAYPDILTFGAEFSTRGYAPDFVTDWYDNRRNQGLLEESSTGLRFAPTYTVILLQELNHHH